MYVLHYLPDNASLVVRLVLSELGLPYACRLIDRAGGALDNPQYRALQPMGLIPALETPDGPMFETAAILLYLCDRHPGLAPAPTDPARAAFLSWFIFTNNSVHTTLMQLYYPDRLAGAACVPQALAAAHVRMQSYLDALDRMVGANAPDWLSPDRPTLLGYYLGMLLRWLSSKAPDHPAYFRSADFPALHPIMAMLESRPAAIAAAQAESLGPTIFTNPTT